MANYNILTSPAYVSSGEISQTTEIHLKARQKKVNTAH